ncbi:NUDIX domain-containing protein (plasmid) [Bacillus cereus]|uniref:MutT/Nudix family protein n=1 Tax=Bacillus cereus (strain ZK / E33L) TaxID=288681 RepID=Q4V1J2_BACCZ|nr:NUDIX domain-containing protein [Bacillus cereus]AAY60415.1 MutT/Nudix family protein [Bacillus cereus E33L]AJI26023.1 NUDIX domain protein [Bacillus cereus E33L]QQA19202.1 NUDIX domain-containing protein [Bacillus cereus]
MNPRVGVGAFIIDENEKLLLILRNTNPERMHWSIPGGKVEWMETVEDTVVREIKEETSLDIKLESLLCVTDHIIKEQEVHWVCPTYIATVNDGVVKRMEPDKILEIGWFSLNDLPKPLTLTTIKALEAYRKENVRKC